MAFNSYRYPRYHLSPPTRVGSPWTPTESTGPDLTEQDADGEIELTTIDLREAQGTVTRF